MSRYDTNNILLTADNKPYFNSRFYPNVPLSENDIYVITTIGDRLDLLAYTYYKDPTVWWVIAMANNNVTKGSLFPVPGTQLRIPLNLTDVIISVGEFNKLR